MEAFKENKTCADPLQTLCLLLYSNRRVLLIKDAEEEKTLMVIVAVVRLWFETAPK